MYGTVAQARKLIRDFPSTQISDDELTAFATDDVDPYINARVNSGQTISSPSTLVKSIEAHGVACMAYKSIYAKRREKMDPYAESICAAFKSMMQELTDGTLADSSVTAAGTALEAADPADDFLEETVFVGADALDWVDRTESRE